MSSLTNSDGAVSTTRILIRPPGQNKEWPSCSASSLPPLPSHVVQGLEKDHVEYSINEECTSLKLVPSGRFVVAGFTDGTLRLFDLTGRFCKTLNDHSSSQEKESLFDTDSSSDEEHEDSYKNSNTTTSTSKLVLSKHHQQYGAVAAQIHARGVHTSLRMKVDCSQDGQYCFAGVSRGSVELVAVNLSKLKDSTENENMLDLVQVHRHADAKLKGFGACTRLRNHSNQEQRYLLFTGLGIKNIHIWSFTHSHDKPVWQCLYDTQTNGNSINLLKFRHDPNGLLQGISKSDDQKLRVWDLSYEQHQNNKANPFFNRRSVISNLTPPQQHSERPKRPPFVDVSNTQSALGVAGSFCVCGGGGMYNQMSVVPLDVENVVSTFNHTDLALPNNNSNTAATKSRRQQRGELKSIVSVAGMDMDAGHVLLELSNGSLVQYSQNHDDSVGLPRLQALDPSLFVTRSEKLLAVDPHTTNSRQLCLTRVGSQGIVVAAVSSYNSNTGKGAVVLRRLVEESPPKGFWGFQAAGGTSAKPTPKNKASNRNSGSCASAKPLPSGAHPIVTPRTVRKKVPPTPKAIQPAKDRNGSKKVASEQSPTLGVASSVESPNAVLHSTATPKATLQQLLHTAVSPEQPSPPVAEVPNKKDGAMIKFLRPNSEQQVKKMPPVMPSTSTKEDRDKSSLEEKMQKVSSKSTKTPKAKKATKRKQAESTEKKRGAATKRTRSSSPKKLKARTQHAVVDGTIRKVAGALCDIRKGAPRRSFTPTQKLQPRPSFLSPKAIYKLPKPLVNDLPKTTVAQRLGWMNNSGNSCTAVGEESTEKDPSERQRLAAKHRAEHEMLRRRVLASTDRVMRSVVSSTCSLEEAHSLLDEDIAGYEEMVHDTLGRQQMEASTLAAQQSLNKEAPVLQVSFPFPEVFTQARASFQTFCSSGSK